MLKYLFTVSSLLIYEINTQDPDISQFKFTFCHENADGGIQDPIYRYQYFTIQKLDAWPQNVNYNVKFAVFYNHYPDFPVVPKDIPPGYTLEFKAFELDADNYFISIEIKKKFDFINAPVNLKCFITIQRLQFVSIFGLSHVRTVPGYRDINLFGNQTFQKNVARYTWTCTLLQVPPPNICTQYFPMNSENFHFKDSFVGPGTTFKVQLTMQLDNGQSASFAQDLVIKRPEDPYVDIICMKNCPPKTFSRYNHKTYFKAVCLINCQDISEQDYKWEIKPKDAASIPNFQIDYKTQTQYGQFHRKFIINKNTLRAGTYVFTLTIDKPPKYFYAEFYMTYPPPPKITNCRTNPRDGISGETQFTLICDQENPGEVLFYAIYTGDVATTERVIGGNSPQIFGEKFILPNNEKRDFFVSASYTYESPLTVVKLATNVTSVVVEEETPKEVVKHLEERYYGSGGKSGVSDLLHSRKEEDKLLGLQILQSVTQDLQGNENSTEATKFEAQLKRDIAKDLMNMNITTSNEVLQVAGCLHFLTKPTAGNPSDAVLAKDTSIICTKVASTSIDIVRSVDDPFSRQSHVAKVATALEKCSEVYSRPDPNILKTKYVMNDTKIEATADAPAITEDYPNYENKDDNYFNHLHDMQETTYNIINTTSIIAKTVALTTALGEQAVKSEGNESSTVVAKDHGLALKKSNLTCLNVTLVPSEDLEDTHDYDILLTVWKRDIMWWNPGKVKIATQLANIEFWHSSCKDRLRNLTYPAKLTFLLAKHKAKIYEGGFIYNKTLSELDEASFNSEVVVYRVVVPPKITVRVVFHGLQNTSESFLVASSIFDYPSLQDFKKSQVVDRKNDLYQAHNEMNLTVYMYIGFFPAKNPGTATRMVEYRVSFELACCVRWIVRDNRWKPSCLDGLVENRDSNLMTCACKRFSVLAGYVQDAEAIRQIVMDDDFKLKIVSYRLICVATSITIALFCILILLAASKKKASFYYLADNIKSQRYAYLLVVKTGYVRNSGTTSNVMVKLIGRKRESDPHVLNYPDPEMRLLQRYGEDMFVLVCQKSLGEIKEIELWFDCIGGSPSWFCKDILIYDMQNHEEYYFTIDARFSVDYEIGSPYLRVSSTLPASKTKQTWLSHFQIFGQFHTWYLSSVVENFTFVKRITTVLSKMLMTYALVLCFIGLPELKLNDVFDVPREYIYSVKNFGIGLWSALIAFFVHLGISWSFRYSKIEISRLQKQTVPLPFYCTVIGWMSLVCIIVVSTTYLVIYGFWVPYYKGIAWLVAVIVGIVADVLIYENIFVIVYNYVVKPEAIKLIYRHEDILKIIESHRSYLYRRFGKYLLRPYLQHLYQPLQKHKIKKKYYKSRTRRRIVGDLEDLFMFAIYTIILYVVVLSDRDSYVVRCQNHIIDIMRGRFTRTMTFQHAEQITKIYEFILKTLIPSMQSNVWYGNYTQNDPGLMIDQATKYLGIVRLRQHRMRKRVCEVFKPARFLNLSCRPEFTLSFEEYGNFGYKWSGFTKYFEFDRMKKIWEYEDSSETGTLPVIGSFSIYPGGGYVAYLGRTLYNSMANFQTLLERDWIDKNTRTIFIEFLTYNVNLNVFNSVTLLMEQSATGYTKTHIIVDSAKLLSVHDEFARIATVFMVLFLGWICLLLLRQTVGIIRRAKTFYKDLWFVVDSCIILLSIACVVLLLIRERLVRNYIRSLEKVKHNAFVPYFKLFYMDKVFCIVAAVLICVATIRLWRFLRFARIFQIMEKTLSLVAAPILTLTVVFATILMGFGWCGMLLFGSNYVPFSNLVGTCGTLTKFSFRIGKMNISHFISDKISYVFFTVYLIVGQVILMFYVATVIIAHCQAKEIFSGKKESYTIITYINEVLNLLPKMAKIALSRLRSGHAEVELKNVTPKPDEIRYADCLSIPKASIDKMRIITKCVLHRKLKNEQQETAFDDSDSNMMFLVCHFLVFKEVDSDNIDFFYKGRVFGSRISLIEDLRLLKIAGAVNLMLDEERRRKSLMPVKKKKATPLMKCAKIVRRSGDKFMKWELTLEMIADKLEDAERRIKKLK